MSITLEKSSLYFSHTNQNTDQTNPAITQETDQFFPSSPIEQKTDSLFEAFLEFIQADDGLGSSKASNTFEDKLNQITLTNTHISNLYTIDHTYAKNIKHKESEKNPPRSKNDESSISKESNNQEIYL